MEIINRHNRRALKRYDDVANDNPGGISGSTRIDPSYQHALRLGEMMRTNQAWMNWNVLAGNRQETSPDFALFD
jgi:hypothetical protein